MSDLRVVIPSRGRAEECKHALKLFPSALIVCHDLSGWVGSVIGVVGRDIEYDITLKMRADIDFCLRALLEHRIIFVDNRFSFIHHAMFAHKGGNAHMRGSKRSQQEIGVLQQRWGQWVSVRPGKTTVRIIVNVKRRQSGFNK